MERFRDDTERAIWALFATGLLAGAASVQGACEEADSMLNMWRLRSGPPLNPKVLDSPAERLAKNKRKGRVLPVEGPRP